MAGLDAHRMEEKKMEYFSSINSMARKIMEEREKIREKHGSSWDRMTPNEQDDAIDNSLMDPQIRARYAMHRVDRGEVVCYPKLLLQTGQKIVHFGDEVVIQRPFSVSGLWLVCELTWGWSLAATQTEAFVVKRHGRQTKNKSERQQWLVFSFLRFGYSIKADT